MEILRNLRETVGEGEVKISTPALLMRAPKPQTDAELAIVSELYFGAPLCLRKLRMGDYEVEQMFDSYAQSIRSDEYSRHREFWNWCCGHLYCGGVAGRSYGQFVVRGHRHKRRLERWINSRRAKNSSSVRTPFVRLAERLKGSERTPRSATKGVLTDGREDGTSAASSIAGVDPIKEISS